MARKSIKSLIPTWILNNYQKRKSSQHMGGVDTTSSAKDTLNKVSLSVLIFVKIYENTGEHKNKSGLTSVHDKQVKCWAHYGLVEAFARISDGHHICLGITIN